MLGEWIIRSTDGGQTWSAPSRCGVNSPHGPVSLSDGRLIYAGKELYHGEQRIGASVSVDDGVTGHTGSGGIAARKMRGTGVGPRGCHMRPGRLRASV